MSSHRTLTLCAAAATLTAVLASVVPANSATARPGAARSTATNGQIAFYRHDPAADANFIFTVNPDGTGLRQLLSEPLECPIWSPEGTQIVTCGNGSTILDVASGTTRTLSLEDPAFNPSQCSAWSPDGSRLACDGTDEADPSRNGLITIRSSDGGDMRHLTSVPGQHDTPGSYSPDGHRIVFQRINEDDEFSGLFVINTNGTHLHRIVPDTVQFGGDRAADWSPKGNTIVFARRMSDDVRLTLWTVHADGTGLRELHVHGATPCGGAFADATSVGCFDPSWSPDGKKIAFNRNNPTAGEHVYTMNADGTGLQQVTTGPDEFPDWGTHALG